MYFNSENKLVKFSCVKSYQIGLFTGSRDVYRGVYSSPENKWVSAPLKDLNHSAYSQIPRHL